MPQRGLLLVLSEPSAALEEELNAWYDSEHVPERLAIDGFISAARFVSTDRSRRYLTLYDLDGIDVLHSEQYKAHAAGNYTPWTRRIVAKARFTRVEAVQELPGDASLVAAPGLLLVEATLPYPSRVGEVESAAQHCFGGRPEVFQYRVFGGRAQHADRSYVIATGVGDLSSLVRADAFGGSARLAGVERFRPY